MKRRNEIICGIYKITNLINKKAYIGQSTNIYERWRNHVHNDSKGSLIHNAIRKYGEDNFNFEIIEKLPQDKLNEREIYWINYYHTYVHDPEGHGYNLTLGGDAGIKYDYSKIIKLWNSGLSNKEICDQLHCADQVVTKALRSNNISEEEVRSRSNCYQKKPIVAIDIVSKKPLKIFNSIREAILYFNKNIVHSGGILDALKNNGRRRYCGYYWEYLTDNNKPIKELSNEEFLSYKQKKLFTLSEKQRKHLVEINRKVERCDRETLKSLIHSTPFTKIGKMYNVSDNAIRKWCIQYNLPHRVKDIKAISDEEWINI